MSSRQLPMGLLALLTAAILAAASAQSSGCTSAIVSLSPCLSYITGNDSAPSSSCCQQLAMVAQSDPQCLCMVLNGGGSTLPVAINRTKALALPTACNVQTPPVSQCNGNGGPAASPNRPPPSTPPPPSGGGSKAVPTIDTSDGTAAQILPSLVLSLLFVAAYLSTTTAFYFVDLVFIFVCDLIGSVD